jgi:putative addiction module component (TIGR02574 family)
MSAATKTILNSALSLPDGEKAILVDELLQSMLRVDPEVERAWDEEIGRRVDAYEKGDATSYSAEEVFEELRRA